MTRTNSPLRMILSKTADALVTKAFPSRWFIALGRVDGIESDFKFGENPDIDTGTVPEDITNLGGTYAGQPTGAAETVEVFSDSANDAAAGTGARTVQLIGLDADYMPQTVNVTLNGLTAVTTTETWTRVFRAACKSFGSLATNDGTITIRHSTTTANVFAVIDPGDQQTLVAARTVPAAKTALLHRVRLILRSGSPAGASADVDLRVREPGEGFRMRDRFTVSVGGPSPPAYDFPLSFPAQSDIKLTVISVTANNLSINGGFSYTLHDDV